MSTEPASPILRELTTDQCHQLLNTQRVGRLVMSASPYPLVFPVNYGLDRGIVVIRTSPGTKLAAADHKNVTFEVDQIDPVHRAGWSVIVCGLAERVTPAHREELIERTIASGVEPWAPVEHGEWLRLIPHQITGRWILAGQLPDPAPHGYL